MTLNLIRLCLPFILIIPYSVFCQNPSGFVCGFEASSDTQIQTFEQQIQKYLARHPNQAEKPIFPAPYVIPVVVHIIHNNGPENIPDSRVIAAINHLNDGFAAQGYFAGQGSTMNTQIQFCLAAKDPNGQATIGITRNQSALTNLVLENDDINLKDINRWKPNDYLNIWVVNDINSLSFGPGIAGYAFFPSAHGLPQDGIVCEAKYFGLSSAEDALLIHEAGHYLGLYHTFEGGCTNNDCTIDGDRVCDTPPDMATHTACPFNSCVTDVAPGSPFSGDVDDLTANFLDYSPFPCYQSFTAGQTDRMHGTLETARKSLLQSTACLGPCSQLFMAAFTPSTTSAILGQPITFTNNSVNATQFTWFDNGVIFSQQEHPTYIFNTVGVHHIVLDITNNDPNCLATTGLLIQVSCNIQAAFSPDQLVATEGSSVHFSNQTTGGGVDTYEWNINGQVVSATTDLDYLFTNPGFYTITLTGSNAFCQHSSSIQITITSTCGLTPEPGKVAYTGVQKLFQPRELAILPDGSILQVGEHFQRPMITRWDANGNLVWNREASIDGTVTQIVPTLDGKFLITGDLNNEIFLATMDENGNVLWSKTFRFTQELGFKSQRSFEVMAVNPDGTFGFLHRDDSSTIATYLTKFTTDGNLIWSTKLYNLELAGSLRIAEDGSGDFVFAGHDLGIISGGGLFYCIVDQNGNLKTARKHRCPAFPLKWLQNFGLGIHKNGDYTLFYTEGDVSFPNSIRKFMARFTPDGTQIWGYQFTLPNSEKYKRCFIRQLPDEKGFVLIDSRTDASFNTLGDWLERMDTAGQVLWTRDIGDTPANDFWGMPPIYDSGKLRSVHCDFFNFELEVLNVYDSNRPMTCAPILNNLELTTPVTFSTNNTNIYAATKIVPIEDIPLVLANVALQKREVCTYAAACPENCANELDDDLDGLTDCFDTDCPCFTKDTTCKVTPPRTFDAQLNWESAASGVSVTSVPIAGNLNPGQDSLPEIVLLEGISNVTNNPIAYNLLIFNGDGSNATTPYILPVAAGILANPSVQPTIADLDRNGVPELLVTSSDGLVRVYSGFNPNTSPCMSQWAISDQPAKSPASRVSVADFNEDGTSEIYCGNQVFQLNIVNPSVPILSLVLNGTGAQGNFANQNNGLTQNSSAADLLTVAECNGDPDCRGLEIAAGYQIYSVDLDPTDGDGLEIKVQRDLHQLDPGSFYQDGYTTIADINLDGEADILVSGVRNNATGGFYAWNKNGLVHNFIHNSFGKMNGMICIAEVFNDQSAGYTQNYPEIILSQPSGLVCTNIQKAQDMPAQPFWWQLPIADPTGSSGTSAFDFNGDGLLELVHRDQNSLRVIYGGPAPYPVGVDADRQWYKAQGGSITKDEYPVIADVNMDGHADILVTGYTTGIGGNPPPIDSRGTLRVYQSAGIPWRPARALWHQFHYFGLNIADNLSVPKNQQKHWLDMNGLTDRPYNSQLTQISSLNPDESFQVSASDLVGQVDSVVCQIDSFRLHITLCNQGIAPIGQGIPITIYTSNPLVTAATLLTAPIFLQEIIPAGQCQSLTLHIPALMNTSLYLVVNDNGSLTTPYQWSTDFPSSTHLECDYSNNLDTFILQSETPQLDLGPDFSLCKNSVIELSATPGFQRYRWQDGKNTPDFTAYQPGKYWVDAFDACGLKQTDTVIIQLNAIDTLNLPAQLSICSGDSVHLEANGFTEYTWSPADKLSCSNCKEVTLSPEQSMVVYVTAKEGICFVTDSVQVNVSALPDITLSPTHGWCGMPAVISTSVLGNDPFQFAWNNGSTEQHLTTQTEGTYTVNVTDQNNCKSSAETTVFIQPALILDAAFTWPECANETNGTIDLIIESGELPVSFIWSNNATTEDLQQLGSGQYSVEAIDANGCTAVHSVTIIEPPLLTLAIQIAPLICPGDSGLLTAVVNGGVPPLQFNWSGGATTQNLMTNVPGPYHLTITDSLGCTVSQTQTFQPISPFSCILASDSVSCYGGADGSITVLSAQGGTGNLEFSLDNQHFGVNLHMTDLVAGPYQLYLKDSKGCLDSFMVEVGQPELWQLQISGDVRVLQGDSVYLHAEVISEPQSNFDISWQANGAFMAQDEWDIRYPIFQNTVFEVLVEDANGCKKTESWLVESDAIHKVYAPNIIAPDKPGNANQHFLLFTDASAEEVVYLLIFDRWGNQVFARDHFSANEISYGWDGTFRGQLVLPGVYVWSAQVLFRDGTVQNFRGDVSVLR